MACVTDIVTNVSFSVPSRNLECFSGHPVYKRVSCIITLRPTVFSSLASTRGALTKLKLVHILTHWLQRSPRPKENSRKHFFFFLYSMHNISPIDYPQKRSVGTNRTSPHPVSGSPHLHVRFG